MANERNPAENQAPNQTPPMHELLSAPYAWEQAVRYADYWAYRRNPNYYAFDQIGGDCTSFVSQAIFYAAGVMNFTPTYGWYYISLDNRSPSWSGVTYFWNFFTSNMGPGPYGHPVPLSQVRPGDVIQMAIKEPDVYGHTVLVTGLLSENPDEDEILVAAHDRDSACRPVSTYPYHMIRALHIDGVRYLSAATDQPTMVPEGNKENHAFVNAEPNATALPDERPQEDTAAAVFGESALSGYQEPPAVG